MLIIGGVQMTGIDDPILVQRFGYSYQQSERLGNILAGYFEDDPIPNVFSNVLELSDYIASHNRGKKLIIMHLHKQYNKPYPIVMQGSRERDYEEANIAAQISATPDGYTWHHAEGIVPLPERQYGCYMYLIESQYHTQNPHCGAVYEYELLTGEAYG